MGIRCYCPNGHKLNLKSFLAGKKGICPECGAKFRIPFADSDEPAIGLPDSSLANRSRIASGLPDFDFSFPDPQVTPASRPEVAEMVSSPAGGAPASASQPAISPNVSPATPAHVDPLGEQPDAVWYVRTPTGEQYGPAMGPVMRTWLAEGRISKDSYVWRDGWPDWRLGSDVWVPFPTPGSTPRPAQSSPSGSARPQLGSGGPAQFSRPAPVGRSPSVRTATARSYPSRNATLTFVILLAFVCIVLLAALVWVVQSGQ